MDHDLLMRLDQHWNELQRSLRNHVRRAVREEMPTAAGGSAFAILALLLRRGPRSPSDLAHHLDVRTSTMTAHLDRLEEIGWVLRRAGGGTASGARVLVHATASGEAAYGRYLTIRQRVLAEFLEPLQADRREVLAAVLEEVVEAHRVRRSRGRSEGDSVEMHSEEARP